MSISPLPSGFRDHPQLARGESSSEKVEQRLSYAWNDWCVTEQEEREALDLLVNDDNVNQTIAELQSRGFLDEVFSRIDDADKRGRLIDSLADHLSHENAEAVQDALREVDKNESGRNRVAGPPVDAGLTKQPRWELRFNLSRAGIEPDATTAGFDRSAYHDILRPDHSLEGIFTGSGATGTNPVDRDIPLTDQWQLFRNSQDSTAYPETKARYSNPLSHQLVSHPANDANALGHPEYWQSEDIEQWLAQNDLDEIELGDEAAMTTQVRGKIADDLYESELAHRAVFGHNRFELKDVDLEDKEAVLAVLAPRIDNLTERYVDVLKRMDHGPDHERRRSREAQLLLNAPVSSSMPSLYGDQKPTRASVIEAAANRYRLEPALVAGIILAEQRDQSANEDAVDYQAAVMTGHDSSIGLGQVTVSTAMADNAVLLSDSLSEQSRKDLTKSEVAKLLSDDIVNIFATAAAIRQIADKGAQAGHQAGSGEAFCNQEDGGFAINGNTCSYGHSTERQVGEDGSQTFVDRPFDITDYALHSREWPTRHIAVLGSEYTTHPWDDTLFRSWGDLVLNSYTDVNDSGVFG